MKGRVSRTSLLFATFALAAPAASLVGCGDDELWVPPPTAGSAAAPSPAPEGRTAPASADAGVDGAVAVVKDKVELPQRQFTEADFSETERNRDPFRGFVAMFAQQAKGRTVIQRQVLIDRYSLDELKLVGVITRAPARALFTDPTGLGWVIKVGDYVGKPEIVHTGGPSGIDVAVNWRVDRIRDSDVVFVREDPSHPEIAPVTRVTSLFPAEEQDPGSQGKR